MNDGPRDRPCVDCGGKGGTTATPLWLGGCKLRSDMMNRMVRMKCRRRIIQGKYGSLTETRRKKGGMMNSE